MLSDREVQEVLEIYEVSLLFLISTLLLVRDAFPVAVVTAADLAQQKCKVALLQHHADAQK